MTMPELPNIDGAARVAALASANQIIVLGVLKALVANGTMTKADIADIAAMAPEGASAEFVRISLQPFLERQ